MRTLVIEGAKDLNDDVREIVLQRTLDMIDAAPEATRGVTYIGAFGFKWAIHDDENWPADALAATYDETVEKLPEPEGWSKHYDPYEEENDD